MAISREVGGVNPCRPYRSAFTQVQRQQAPSHFSPPPCTPALQAVFLVFDILPSPPPSLSMMAVRSVVCQCSVQCSAVQCSAAMTVQKTCASVMACSVLLLLVHACVVVGTLEGPNVCTRQDT
uniref:Uncharacterized protein n=1 Tax=Timema genevievae TaxID=629358 RepID=A0A7R9PR97_TIMGE|nr:unnamed protein product [Timema genevievae]